MDMNIQILAQAPLDMMRFSIFVFEMHKTSVGNRASVRRATETNEKKISPNCTLRRLFQY